MEIQESLSVIESMIQQSRHRFKENGHLFLFWGWLTVIVSLVHYVLIVHVNVFWGHNIWFVMTLGYVYKAIFIKRIKEERKAESFTDRAMKYVWIAFLMGMLVTIVSMPTIGYKPYPWFLMLFGMATFCSGGLLQFKPLIIGGLSNLVLAILANYSSIEVQMILLPIAISLSYIVPGHILHKKPVFHV